MKFLKCKTCGKIVALIKDTGVSTVCCGNDMAYCNLHSLWASN